jgi:hypothetical protein
MFDLLWLWFGVLLRLFRSRQVVMIENLALRQQLAVFKRRRRRPKLATMDKLFWVILRRFWSSWREALIWYRPIPSCVGTEPVFICIGGSSRVCISRSAEGL